MAPTKYYRKFGVHPLFHTGQNQQTLSVATKNIKTFNIEDRRPDEC